MEDRPRHVWSPFEYLLREDPALKSLVVVWVCTAAMLVVDIPIVAMTHTGIILPAATVGAAALGTMGISIRSRRTSRADTTHSAGDEELRQRVAELEARIANLEVIDRYEHHLAEKTAAARQAAAAGIGIGMNRPHRDDGAWVSE